MRTDTPVTIRRLDYAPCAWRIEHVRMHVALEPSATRITTSLALARADDAPVPLVLDGVGLALESIALDGAGLAPDRYAASDVALTVHDLPARCILETVVTVDPAANTALEGLYRSSGTFCTQCEAEGFRKITWYLDRPDVLATFEVTLEADIALAPVLLSNGNLVSSEVLDGGVRHRARWHDPHPKPGYLFALVAGDLVEVEDRFRTRSGVDVHLSIFVEAHNARRCDFAMASLKHAMAWDERVYGFEYDLERFMIVAVDDFNMGAMENKGLNVFNSKFVLADPETATDADYLWIEAVIAHEYFHNWTGNRVTCRDWFQLSLKEGLTVFRDQCFTADRHSATVKRIDDVRRLRAAQFPEDAGPLAHPIRPDSYIEINNFYTTTVYEKGAEVVRMLHVLLGEQGFHRGIDLYIRRHDGSAATCEAFVVAMEDANGRDLTRFRLWYALAGTPVLECTERWEPADGTDDRGRWSLTVRQRCPDTPGQRDKPPMHLPFAVGLLDADGRDIPFDDGVGTRVFELVEREQTIVVDDLPCRPVASLLRGFSAPVRLERTGDEAALAAATSFLAAHDGDGFNRWEAGQRIAESAIRARLEGDAALEAHLGRLREVIGRALDDDAADPALRAEVLTLPSIATLAERYEPVDILAIDAAWHGVAAAIADANRDALVERVRRNRTVGPRGTTDATDASGFGGPVTGERALANAALALLATLEEGVWVPLAETQYRDATTMTDRAAALGVLCHAVDAARDRCLADFRERFDGNALAIDKWFALQAASRRADTLEAADRLSARDDFDVANPNRLRALVATLAGANPLRFHDPGGAGYRFVGRFVSVLDATNPQIAARLVAPLARWRRHVPSQAGPMRHELERVLADGARSPDVVELVSRSLEG